MRSDVCGQSYRIYAIKYAQHDRRSGENFIGGDFRDVPMSMDFFVWAVVGESRTVLVDSGFDQTVADKRKRTITNPVERGLERLGIRPDSVEDVIITHMHYDHAGNHSLFPRATYHIQDREMAYCTGRSMCHTALNDAFEPEDLRQMLGRVFDGRVQFHDGDSEIAAGLTVHRIGGHTDGLQVVRVHTERGWVVLASDAAHFYAHMREGRPYPIVHNVGQMLEGYDMLVRLASSAGHIIPGHDPAVLSRYPAHDPGTEGWIVRLDLEG